MNRKRLSIFVSGLLALALLGGCVQPGKSRPSSSIRPVSLNSMPVRAEMPLMVEQGNGSVPQTSHCLLAGMREFRIPDEFIVQDAYSNGATVKLVNPATGKDGLIFDLLPKSSGSQINVYANGMDVSQRWRKMVSRCASQPGA